MTTDTPCGPAAAYQPHFADKARNLCKLGLTDDELAFTFRIPLATLLEWQDSVPEFANAVWEGRLLADGQAADGLHRRAVGASHDAVRIFFPAGADTAEQAVKVPYTRHYPPETPACKFWLINRRPENWSDKVHIETPAHDDDTDNLTDAELAAIATGQGGRRSVVPTGGTQ
jgi:hypothetical protein